MGIKLQFRPNNSYYSQVFIKKFQKLHFASYVHEVQQTKNSPKGPIMSGKKNYQHVYIISNDSDCERSDKIGETFAYLIPPLVTSKFRILFPWSHWTTLYCICISICRTTHNSSIVLSAS